MILMLYLFFFMVTPFHSGLLRSILFFLSLVARILIAVHFVIYFELWGSKMMVMNSLISSPILPLLF